MKKFLSTFSMFLILVGLVSCSPENNIKKSVDQVTDDFIDSDTDYSYYDAETRLYIVNDDSPNYLANEEVRELALAYGSEMGLADRLSKEASNYLTSDDSEYRYNPNRYELSSSKRAEAERYKAQAEIMKQQLKDLVATHPQCQNGGIWVYHEIAYKEYLYKSYAGPYVKRYLYLFSDNGKEVIWKTNIDFFSNVVWEMLTASGTQFEQSSIQH